MSHSWAGFQFWTSLAAGRRIALVREGDTRAAVEAVARHGVTMWLDYAPTFERVVELGPQALVGIDTSTLTISIGPSGASPELKKRLVEMFGPIVTESYGFPETGLIALSPVAEEATKEGSCGRPSPGVVVEIRNASGQVLPPNSVGEIWARTPASIERELMCETLEQVRDANDFVRTGDRGKLDEDGFLFVIPQRVFEHGPVLHLAGTHFRR